MPYDATPQFNDPPQDVRNLLTLADALEREHEGFEWDFNRCLDDAPCGSVGCALGLGKIIGLFRAPCTRCAEPVLDISAELAGSLFLYHYDYGVPEMDDVTPAMVATRLREIAAAKMAARVGAV